MGADDLLQENYVACMTDLIRTFPSSAMFLGGVNVVDDAGKTVFPLADRVKQALRPSSDPPADTNRPCRYQKLRSCVDWTHRIQPLTRYLTG